MCFLGYPTPFGLSSRGLKLTNGRRNKIPRIHRPAKVDRSEDQSLPYLIRDGSPLAALVPCLRDVYVN